MMMLSEKLTERTSSSSSGRLFVLLMAGLAVAMALCMAFAGKAEAKEKVPDKDPKGNEVASGELLVTYKRDASEQATEEASKKVSGHVEEDFSEIEVQHLSFPEVKNERDPQVRQKTLEQKKADLERDPAVEAVDYNYAREAGWVPNDGYYGYQWGYPKIRAPQAWDITQGSSSVKVAVLDGGIDNNHADLKGKVVGQYDFGDGDTDATNRDGDGHGTHVAGTVAASTNNGTGVAGTCANCSLLFAKVFDSNGQVYDSYVIPALNWSANNGARVINMSFGGPAYSSTLETAINRAWSKQAVLVGAAMNNGTSGTKYYPAAYDNVIAVAATDSNDQKYFWSNSGDWVDVAAPGVDIYSTLPSEWAQALDLSSGETRWVLRPRYGYLTGTSMAAPHVSGLAGLLFSTNGGLTNKEVRYRIERTALDIAGAGWSGKDPIIGWGRIDACAALGSCKKLTVKG